jgi:hypothetical protein
VVRWGGYLFDGHDHSGRSDLLVDGDTHLETFSLTFPHSVSPCLVLSHLSPCLFSLPVKTEMTIHARFDFKHIKEQDSLI